MIGSSSGSGLSVRAANVLRNMGIDDAKGSVACAAALDELAASHGRTVERHLLYQRNAGAVTRREILGWMGYPAPSAMHMCTCRTCGKTFGTATR